MKTDKLYFNEQEVDYNRDLSISANYQINTFENLDSFQTSYTNSISLPKTERNIQILRGLGIEGNDSNVAYRVNRVSYVRNGFMQFENASAIVREISDSFRVNLYFQNNSLFETIEGKNLNDLQLNQFNHDLDIQNYAERLPEGVVTYPLANYGAQTDSTIIFEYQIPAIKVSYLWNRIFNEAGFEYIYKGRGNRDDFNPFVSDEFQNARITLNEGLQETEETLIENVLNLSGDFEFPFINQFSELFYEGTVFEVRIWNLPLIIDRAISFTSITSQNPEIILSNQPDFIIKQSNFYKITLAGTAIASNVQQCEIEIKKNGLIIDVLSEIEIGNNEITSEQRYYLSENDVISFSFRFENPDNEQSLGLNYDLTLNIDIDNQFKNVNFSQYLETTSQKDFIKSIANKFGLIFVQKGNLYEFISLKELLTPYARYSNLNQFFPVNFTTEDWSCKFHRKIKEQSKLSNQWSQKSLLKYNYDNPENTFADSLFEINDKTLKVKSTILKSEFNAPEFSKYRIANNQLRRMPLYELEEEGVKPKKNRPFIINTRKITGTFNYKQIGGDVQEYSGEFQIATFDNLSYTQLKNKWLQPLENVLEETKLIECEVSLSEKDLSELNWFTLKYIKQLNGLFYLSKIINFTNAETTRIELIRVKAVEQLGEFSDDFNEDFNI